MICLSLRVTGDRNPDRNKMMDQRVDEIKSVVKTIAYSLPQEEKWFNDLIDAETLKEQIAIVALIFEQKLKMKEEINVISALKLLMEMYLKLPYTNPLKKYILSSLSEMESENKTYLSEIVVGLLNKFNGSCSSQECEDFISLLNCINSCFNNKSDCFKSLTTNCSICIFIGGKDLISSCSVHLGDSSMTPVFKEKMLKNIHSLTQGIITFLHKVTSECVPAEFLESCKLFLNDDNLPLDTKTNIAIIIGMVNQMTSAYNWDELIRAFSMSAPITVVSLCSGIFSAAPESLWIKLSQGQYLADFILHELLNLEEKNSSDCKLVLGVSRGVCQYTKVRINSVVSLSDEDASVERVLSYLWIHLEHPMDAVRHLASESLSNVVSLGQKFPESNIIKRIMGEVIHIPLYRRSKYVILSSLVGYIPVDDLLTQVPNLVNILLMSLKESSGAKHVVVSFEKLLSQHYLEMKDKKDWLHIWVNPVVECLNNEVAPVMEQILTQIIKLNPPVIDYILGLDDQRYNNKIKIVLLSLRVSQKIGILKGNSEVKWKGFIEYTFLESSLHHKERDARLSLFGLIVDSSKSTEPFSAKELDLVQLFLKYNVSCQSAAFRQCLLALFKKFLNRMKDSHNHDKCNNITGDSKSERDQKYIDVNRSCSYLKFLDWAVKFCCEQLFPGAAFSRRSTVLNMLSLIFFYDLCDKTIFTKKMAHRLLYVLQSDTYEENKKLAKEIVQQLDFDLLGLENEKVIYEAFNDCLTFASSIRPPDCISAAYSLSTLLKFVHVKEVFCDLADCVKGLQKSNVKELGIYYCLSMIVDDLASKGDVASKNIHKAAKEGPMYGLLYTIRHILQDLDLNDLSSDKNWIDLIKRIIQIGIQCTKAVSCIVNNSSPEGHLPMDLSLDFSNLTLADGSHQATSQLLLLCSWRTVKEVCLLFGEIVERIDIYPEDDGVHFSVKDVLIVGEHLTSLLSEIKHRGAFEQAYIGFCKLAATLWKYPKGHLHELPSIWLKETLEEIVSSKSKLCATRRSAGIPFIIQALVVTEREVLGGKQLGWTVQRVLKLGNSQSENWETRVHAMNILRSLYKSSHLGEAISPFVAQGFIISFNGFSGQTWSERNSATLLFSALVTRVFGVNRSRSHNLSWKNKMTGRIFFQRYPELYSVILEKLEKSSETDIHSVFPVLLLLSRLYPSSLEGSDSNLRLETLIPFITKCGVSRIMKIRSLAASALVGLIYPFNICDHISKAVDGINGSTSENAVHGSLLQILHLLKAGPEIPNETAPEFHSLINSWFDHIVCILKDNKRSMITRSTCLNFLFQLLLKYFEVLSKNSINNLIEFIKQTVVLVEKDPTPQMIIGYSEYLEFCSILLIHNSFKSCSDMSSDILMLLEVKHYEIFQLILDFMHSVLTYSETAYDELNQFVVTLSKNSRKDIWNNFKSSVPLCNYLFDKIKNESLHHEDSVKLMSVVKELPSVIQKLAVGDSGIVKILCGFYSAESLKSCVIQCFSSYMSLKGQRLNGHEAESLSQLLSDSIKSDFECRMAAADLLVKHYKSIMNGYSSTIVFSVWNCIINLLCDDCEEVRNRMSDILIEQVDSILALEHCFLLFKNQIQDKFIFACALTTWAISPFCEEQYTLEESEKAFDKGDMNSYKEDIILTSAASLVLKDLLLESPDILDKIIPPDVHTWLDEYTGFSTSCQTLHQVIRSLDQYTEAFSEDYRGKYRYFVNFSTSYRNYSLLSEKNDKIEYK